MKTLTLKYKKSGKQAIFEALKSGFDGETLVEKDVLYFEDLDTMFNFMTGSRARIIQAIQEKKPHSIYELAKILDLNQSYVLKEFKFLEQLGVLSGKNEELSGRKTIRPIANYDHIVIDWEVLPKKSVSSF